MATSDGTLHALLDELQAAEEAGAEALGHWLATCDDPHLRGGLRVIRERDLAHARLARRRLVALGGAGTQGTPRQVQTLCGMLAAPDVSNRSKLTILLSRFPARADAGLPAVVAALEDDESRALLETIHEDDRASLRWLREAGETAPTEPVPAAPATSWVLGFLDAFRAAETASAEVIAAWRLVCNLPGLCGGLDTLAEREATHAALSAARLHELGGMMHARVPDAVIEAARNRFGSPAVSDEEKLALVARRYPEDGDVAHPLHAAMEAPGLDPETRAMLHLVASGEAATIGWLRSYHRAIGGRPREISLRVLDGGR